MYSTSQDTSSKSCTLNSVRFSDSRWRYCLLFMLVLMGVFAMFNKSHADSLTEGQDAPIFTLVDQSGTAHSLRDYAGRWVVLYFYPKDDTPGCTKEACAFRDDYKVIVAQNTQVLGVSVDSQASHAEFAEKYGLPFPLLADEGGKVANRYQALTSLGPIKFAKRHTFIIDPEGKIKKIYRKVDANTHSKQILSDLQLLKTNDL